MKTKQMPEIEGYTNLTQIGKGGNGIVYKAIDKENRTVVIKTLSNPKGYNLGRFKIEIEALQKLNGMKGVMPILDFDLDGDIKWFSMPLAQTSKEYWADKGYHSIIDFYCQIAITLTQLHEKKVYHRDIKPDNLLFLDEVPTIADFGLVKMPEAETLTVKGNKLGPLFYMAPEMLNNPDIADAAKADVYSFAKSLWVSLTGQNYPLPGVHDLSYKSSLVSTYIDDNRLLQIDNLISLATKLNPEERISIAEVASNLNEWLNPQKEMTEKFVPSEILKSLAIAATTEKEEHAKWDKYHTQGNEVFYQLYMQLGDFFSSIKENMNGNGEIGGFQKVEDFIRSKRDSQYDSIRKTAAGGGYSFIIYDPQPLEFYCGVGIEIFKNGEINVGAAYILIVNGKEEVLWANSELVSLGTPAQVNLTQNLFNGLIANFEPAMKKLEEVLKANSTF